MSWVALWAFGSGGEERTYVGAGPTRPRPSHRLSRSGGVRGFIREVEVHPYPPYSSFFRPVRVVRLEWVKDLSVMTGGGKLDGTLFFSPFLK